MRYTWISRRLAGIVAIQLLDRDGVTKCVEQLESVAMNYSENPYQDRKMAFGLTLITNRVGPERKKPVWKKETTAQGQEQAQLQGQEREEEKTRLMTWFYDSWFNCNNRTFILTKRGYFGLAPPHAQPGDLICVLLTAYVPFVLRRLAERHHSFVWDSYVHSLIVTMQAGHRSGSNLWGATNRITGR